MQDLWQDVQCDDRHSIVWSHLFVIEVTLLAFGCPVQAIVKAMGLDERTVRLWWLQSGEQSKRVHESVIGSSQLDLEHVQEDEIKVKIRGDTIWNWR